MPSVDLMTYKQKIELDDSKFNSGMTKAQGNFDKFKSGLGTVGGVLGKTIGAGVAAAGGALVAFGKKGIETASDLSEVQNVVDTTFGGNASKINSWAKVAATSFGISELSAKQYNGTMGAMLKSMGLTGDQVTNMSTKMTGLAGDMASFYNLDPSEAFEKIRSGISGEAEPLKQLGINMSVANLNAFAMSQGLGKTYDSMTQTEQATLRYNYLMNTTKDAQGDFAKTSDSMANQMRVAQLKVTDLAGAFGQSLLPMANQALGGILSFVNQSQGAFTNLITGFSGMLTGVQGSEQQFSEGATVLIDKLVQSVVDITPKILTVITNLIPAVITALMANLPTLITTVMNIFPKIASTLLSMLPMILDCGIKVILTIIQGLAQSLPQLIPQIVKTVLAMVDTLINNIDLLVDASIQLMVGLTTGLIQAIPILIAKAPEIITKLVSAIVRNAPKIGAAGLEIIGKLWGTIANTNWLQLGGNLVSGMVKGIWNGITHIDFRSIGNSLLSGIKGVLGIHSPSTVMRDIIGKNMALGIENGFVNNMLSVSKNMQKSIPTDFDTSINYSIQQKYSDLKSSLAEQNKSSSYSQGSQQITINPEIDARIIIQGNSDESTIRQIKKAQEETVRNIFDKMRTLNINSGFVQVF